MAYYLKNRDSFNSAETARVAHIVRNVDERAGEEVALAAIGRAQADLARMSHRPSDVCQDPR